MRMRPRPGTMLQQPSQRGMGDIGSQFDELALQAKSMFGDIDLGNVALYGGLAIGAWMLLSAFMQRGGRRR